MTTPFSRRTLARLLGASAASAATASIPNLARAAALPPPPAAGPRTFPSNFLWGSATASYQVEGAVHEDGRGPSIWDTFSHTPGKVANGDTGDFADDFYHRYPQDIALMKDIGLKGFRFSIAWSRVFPNPTFAGTGAPNPKGLDFYNRLVDTLLANGITPYCTLFHWDLPQSLENEGGWQRRETAQSFAEYAGYVAKHLSDRVHNFMTLNEMRSFVELGYGNGIHAPGLKVGRKALAQVSHHAVLAHGLGVQAIRANAPATTQVGIADNATACTPIFDAPEHVAAARRAMRQENAMFLAPILDGHYDPLYLNRMGTDAPIYTPADMAAIGSALDFVGLNIYPASYVRAANNELGYEMVSEPFTAPRMASPWLYVGPESLYWTPRLVNELWHPKSLYITENGASSDDKFTPDGQIMDTDRTMFLRNYLTQLHRAISEGVPVKGYFCWSLLDNYEWADGYSKRFGIVYVDFKTQKRTPKLSAQFYKATIAKNAIA